MLLIANGEDGLLARTKINTSIFHDGNAAWGGLMRSPVIFPASRWTPAGNSATVPPVDGFAAFTAVGTATARNWASTNALTQMKRLGYVSAAGAGSLASFREAVAQWSLGTGANGRGGFWLSMMFGTSDAATVSGARMFVGLQSATGAATNVEPSTLTNCLGVGHGSADTNLKFFSGGSAAQTPVDLGANFPANTLSADAYRLVIFAPLDPTAETYKVGWSVERMGTAFKAGGVLTGTAGTAVPATTTALNINSYRTNNATALAVGMDLGAIVMQVGA
jgi:hypothetical protein